MTLQPPAPPKIDLETAARALLRMLAALAESHRELLGLIREKREAIRTADIARITATCEAEQRVARRIGDIEKQRLALIGELAPALGETVAPTLALREIAARVEEPLRGRLHEESEALRRDVEAVRRESSIVTAAADGLNRHLAGIMQKVHGALSRVGVYERRGRIAVGSQMDFCVDVKS
jgi:hypothetical protein